MNEELFYKKLKKFNDTINIEIIANNTYSPKIIIHFYGEKQTCIFSNEMIQELKYATYNEYDALYDYIISEIKKFKSYNRIKTIKTILKL